MRRPLDTGQVQRYLMTDLLIVARYCRAESNLVHPIQIYADTYPLHIISMPTILDLAQSLYDFQNRPQDKPCPEFRTDPGSIVQRFRPNIVISTSSHTSSDNTSSKMSAYEEDHWSQIEIGEGDVQVVGRCGRCTLPNMDPVTGTRHPTLPLTLLNAQRPKELDEVRSHHWPWDRCNAYACPSHPSYRSLSECCSSLECHVRRLEFTLFHSLEAHSDLVRAFGRWGTVLWYARGSNVVKRWGVEEDRCVGELSIFSWQKRASPGSLYLLLTY